MGLPQIEIQNLNAMQFSTATNQHEMVAPTYSKVRLHLQFIQHNLTI